MMGSLIKKFFSRHKEEDIDSYVDLDLEEYEKVGEEEVKTYLKTAELTSLNEVPELKKEVYDGNILIIDISLVKQDKLLMERAIRDLKKVAQDVMGDIACLGEDRIIVTPSGIKIERKKKRMSM